MNRNRLEAFSDGVIAIIITIMVLELRAPEGHRFNSLLPIIPNFTSYLLSFIYLGIYWNNHHHMVHTIKGVNGRILWANLHVLFWLSLVPFTTSWMGESHFESAPLALFGVVLLGAAIAYFILQQEIIKKEGKESMLAKAVGKDWKAKLSLGSYALAIAIAFILPLASALIYIFVAVLWLMPDKRIEKLLQD